MRHKYFITFLRNRKSGPRCCWFFEETHFHYRLFS